MDIYAEVTNRIIDQMEKGIIPWQKPWIASGNAISRATGKPYSLLNQMILGRGGEYLTFAQCQKEGGKVRKGEKSQMVVFWKFIEQEDEETHEKKQDELIHKNPLSSKSIRITGLPSKGIIPYSVEQMRFLVQSISSLENPQDRAYLSLHALHPLRPEEVFGLQWQDIDFENELISVERAVTHPTRNQPHIAPPKTLASRRQLDLVPQIIPYLVKGSPQEFILGGDEPLTYTQVRRMCQRIQRETNFDEAITPRRFRTTVLTDLYDCTKDIKQAQAAAGHTTAAMTLKHYVKGRQQKKNSAAPIASIYGL